MITTIVITIKHAKPLPTRVPVTTVAAQRMYDYCFANGVEVEVEAHDPDENPAEVKPC